ncbi:MAG: lycopene cyclase domain-containing protein [Acidobacteriota bacterium]
MHKYEYFIVLALTLAGPLCFSMSRRISFYAHPARLLAAIGLPFALFTAWDSVAAARGHWNFNPEYITSIMIVNLPVEEILFFIVIPFAAIFTWECVKYFLRSMR